MALDGCRPGPHVLLRWRVGFIDFFYIPKMKSPAAAGRIMERGVLGSWGAGAVQILGTKTGAAT